MHIMHGNGTTAESPVVTVQRELRNLLGELERNGQVQQWSALYLSAQLAQPLLQLWADVVDECRALMASASSSEATETAALQLLVTRALDKLAGRTDIEFFSALWTASQLPFHFFLTHARRNALGHVVQATCHKLSEALAQTDPPSVTAANRELSAVTDGPTSPPDRAIFVWRGMESMLQLESFGQEVQSGGCPIAFSLSPDVARSFGTVVVRVLVPERMISCFAKLPKAEAHEAAVVLLHRPCSLLPATDSGPWADRCYRLAEPIAEPTLPPQAGPPSEASGGAAASSGGAGVRQPVEAPRAQAHFVPAGDVAGIAEAVLDELCRFADFLVADGTVKSWMAATAVKGQASLAHMITTRQRKNSCDAADAFKHVLKRSIELLCGAASRTVAHGADLRLHFLTCFWTSNSPPFYCLLTHASRNGLEARVECTLTYVRWALARIKAPTVGEAERVCEGIAGAPSQPPGGALLYRGLPDESLLTRCKEDIEAGRLTSFSLSPTVAQEFGELLVCVAVSEADLACFAHLRTTGTLLTEWEEEALLFQPCELVDEPTLQQSVSQWTTKCYRLRRLDVGGEAAAAVAAEAAAEAEPEPEAAAAAAAAALGSGGSAASAAAAGSKPRPPLGGGRHGSAAAQRASEAAGDGRGTAAVAGRRNSGGSAGKGSDGAGGAAGGSASSNPPPTPRTPAKVALRSGVEELAAYQRSQVHSAAQLLSKNASPSMQSQNYSPTAAAGCRPAAAQPAPLAHESGRL